jgi:hypothetical protein
MRIVNRDEFLKMPIGTLFSKYEPCIVHELLIKGESLIWEDGNDFIYNPISDAIKHGGSDDFANKLYDAQENGTNLTMDFDDNNMRDGCFDYDQLFAIWTKEDLKQLIDKLTSCLNNL